MKLYLVRHGETEWNREGKKQGRTDVSLNEVGISQAEKLRDEIRDKELEFDVCIASPLSRAKQTAEIATEGKYEIILDDRLVERCFGGFEGTLNEDWEKLSGGADSWDLKLNYSERGMESAKEILARAKEFLESVKQKYPDNYRIVVFSHGSFLKALHYTIIGYDENTDFHGFYFQNAEMKEYEV